MNIKNTTRAVVKIYTDLISINLTMNYQRDVCNRDVDSQSTRITTWMKYLLDFLIEQSNGFTQTTGREMYSNIAIFMF